MKTHNLSRKLVLEAPVTSDDGLGGRTTGWQPLGTIWAEVTRRTARSRRIGEAAVSSVGYRIVVRGAPVGAPSRPKAGQRLVEGSRIFRIDHVAEVDAAGRYLLCRATEEHVT